jgi:hypothetical protein
MGAMRFRIGVVVCVGLALAGCSTGPTDRPSPATTSTVAASTTSVAKRYQAIAAVIDLEGTQLPGLLEHLPASDTGPQMLQALEPYINGVKIYLREVKEISWPGALAADAHLVERRTGTLIAVLESIGTQTVSTVPSWLARLEAANKVAGEATSKLRHALGLPPPGHLNSGSIVETGNVVDTASG